MTRSFNLECEGQVVHVVTDDETEARDIGRSVFSTYPWPEGSWAIVRIPEGRRLCSYRTRPERSPSMLFPGLDPAPEMNP